MVKQYSMPNYYEKKDIFGNIQRIPMQTRQMNIPTRMSYQEKLREAKAKRALKEINRENRREQIESVKSFGRNTAKGMRILGRGTINVSRSIAQRTEKSKTAKGLLAKIRSFKNKSIYDKE